MLKRLVLGLAALAMGTAFALADEEVAHDHEPRHKGILVHSGHHHLELVAEGGSLQLYVTHEDGEPEDVSAAKASATVLADGKTETVALAPGGGNKLEGAGSFTAGKGTTVVVTLTIPGHETEQARFKLD